MSLRSKCCRLKYSQLLFKSFLSLTNILLSAISFCTSFNSPNLHLHSALGRLFFTKPKQKLQNVFDLVDLLCVQGQGLQASGGWQTCSNEYFRPAAPPSPSTHIHPNYSSLGQLDFLQENCGRQKKEGVLLSYTPVRAL